MPREQYLRAVLDQLAQCADAFCRETNGLACDISYEYKGAPALRHLRVCRVRIMYSSFAAELRYSARLPLNTVYSVLSCVLYPGKSEEAPAIPLPVAADYCAVDSAAPLCIPFITNADAMAEAFACIAGVLRPVLPEMAVIAADGEKTERLLCRYRDELAALLGIDGSDGWGGLTPEKAVTDMQSFSENYLISRFATASFLLLKGKGEALITRCHKEKTLLSCEKRLLARLEAEKTVPDADCPALTRCLSAYNDRGMPKTDLKEFFALFFSWLVLSLAASPVYVGLFSLAVWFEGRHSVCLVGGMTNLPYCFMAAFLTGIALSYFTRFFFYRLLFRRNHAHYCEVSSFAEGDRSDGFMRGFAGVLITLCLAVLLFLVRWNVNFLPGGFIDNTNFFSLKGTYHSYDELEAVVYRPTRENDFGETLDAPSYVLVFRDKTEIDLYEYGDTETYARPLTELLGAHDIPVKK